ncbi:MAG: hypothetical protein ACYC4L_17235 [Chloroflexota bacterium]
MGDGATNTLLLTVPFILLAVLAPLVPSVLLLVIGWRLMVAQEATARTLREIVANLQGRQ